MYKRQPKDLSGVSFVITAGPTREPIDPARFLSNPSTGKMGFALARAALNRGASVTLIHGPVSLHPPAGATCVAVERAVEMKDAVIGALEDAHVLMMAAAVADWSSIAPSDIKGEKNGSSKQIACERTPDILLETRGVGSALRVGFAAQTLSLIHI